MKRYSLVDGAFLGNFTAVSNLISPIALKFFNDGVLGMEENVADPLCEDGGEKAPR